MNNNKIENNVIDAIEERLKELEKEKDEIENKYGIDKNILEELTIPKEKKKRKNKSTTLYDNLPKLDSIKKKENTIPYKTPESLQESLKYEPSLKDLLDPNDFEPSFSNMNHLKSKPSIRKGFKLSTYIDYINEEYINNYIN